jgi:hypothetical protein
VALGGQEFNASPIYRRARQGKWGDWAGVTHGCIERGCVGLTRLPQTASWQWGKAAAASYAWSTCGGDSSQGPYRCVGVRGDMATMLCGGGHVAEGACQLAMVQAAHVHAMGRLGARQAHVR